MDSGIEVALISASISAVAKADFYVFLIIAFVYAVWLGGQDASPRQFANNLR